MLLRYVSARDAVILEAEMPPSGVRVQMWLQIIKRQVPTDVSVKLTVDIAARISDFRAPNLLAGFDVAGKNGNAVRACDRSINAVSRPWVAVQDRMSIADEIFDVGFFDQVFNARLISTLRQPDAARLSPKMFFIIFDRDPDLRPTSLLGRDQRQEPVCRPARDDLENTFVLQFTKGIYQISFISVVPQRQRRGQIFEVHPRDAGVFLRFALGSMDFFFGKLQQVFEVSRVPVLEHLVGQHFAQRRRNIYRHPRPYARLVQVLKDEMSGR